MTGEAFRVPSALGGVRWGASEGTCGGPRVGVGVGGRTSEINLFSSVPGTAKETPLSEPVSDNGPPKGTVGRPRVGFLALGLAAVLGPLTWQTWGDLRGPGPLGRGSAGCVLRPRGREAAGSARSRLCCGGVCVSLLTGLHRDPPLQQLWAPEAFEGFLSAH